MDFSCMRILIQQVGTGLFLKACGQWVQDKSQAQAFDTSNHAVEFCQERGLQQVQILLSFSDSRYDLVLDPFKATMGHDRPCPDRRNCPGD